MAFACALVHMCMCIIARNKLTMCHAFLSIILLFSRDFGNIRDKDLHAFHKYFIDNLAAIFSSRAWYTVTYVANTAVQTRAETNTNFRVRIV